MITVRIGDSERDLYGIDESWIIDQISKRRKDGLFVWIQVIIEERADINMVLSTPGCPRSGGSSRPPNAKEQEIFDLWDKHGLNKTDFSEGLLVSFLKQVQHKIR